MITKTIRYGLDWFRSTFDRNRSDPD